MLCGFLEILNMFKSRVAEIVSICSTQTGFTFSPFRSLCVGKTQVISSSQALKDLRNSLFLKKINQFPILPSVMFQKKIIIPATQDMIDAGIIHTVPLTQLLPVCKEIGSMWLYDQSLLV